MSWGERSCKQFGAQRSEECQEYMDVITCNCDCPYYEWNGKEQDSVMDIKELINNPRFEDKLKANHYGSMHDETSPLSIACQKEGVEIVENNDDSRSMEGLNETTTPFAEVANRARLGGGKTSSGMMSMLAMSSCINHAQYAADDFIPMPGAYRGKAKGRTRKSATVKKARKHRKIVRKNKRK